MSEKEIQAHDNVRWRNWSRAATMYDQILSSPPLSNNRAQKDRHIICLLGRCECLLELGKYEACLNDSRKVLSMLIEQQTDCLASVSRTRRWLVHALCKLKKYNEVEKILTEWIAELQHHQGFGDICKTLERYKSVIQMLNGGNKMTQKINNARLEDEMTILDTKLDHWATNNLPLDKYSKPLSNKGIKKRENLTQNGSSNNITAVMQKNTDLLAALKVSDSSKSISDESAAGENSTTCSYCAITFGSRNELRQHCQTVAHQNVIMSDEGRDWKWRPPPRGFTLDSYSLCEAWCESQLCHYGNQCVEAHGQDELNEWKERFEYRRMRLQKACEKELYGKSYTEQVLEHWIQSTVPEKIMCEKVEGIEVQCEQDLVTSISSKTSKREWVFMLRTNNKSLKAVALLQDAHRNHFAIKSIKSGETFVELDVKTNQEWVSNKHSTSASATSSVSSLLNCSMDKEDTKQKAFENCDLSNAMQTLIEHQVIVEFHTEIYGTFRQAVCFDFGSEPLLVRHLCVDVVPVSDAEKIEEIRRDIINSSAARWDVSNTHLVKFETTIGSHMKTEGYLNDLKHEKEMLERYPCPRAQTFTLTQSTILDKRLTQNNYRSRIHELLYVEEIARYEQIARFNLRTKLGITSNYILTPAGMATSTAKYSLSGELFALMNLGKDVSEDTSAGRLILSNCSSVYISPVEEAIVVNSKDKKRHVFEAVIEDKGKNVIYLKLGTKCVEGMKLKADTEILVDIQFQLNRLPYCEWHHAVDKITDFKIIFPATEIEPNIPWTPKKQWSETCEPKLNAKQREAVNAITTSLSIKLPPILLIGPFGTGKTYTLAQAIKQLLTQPEAKILICTHSNSAADLYIKEYLHPWIEAGLEEATPLRVYYHKRWVATVNSVVQKYCITDGAGNFRRPTVEDIMKYRIVVVTLSISMELANLDIPKGYFTHIFLDEAAQAMECEAIMPLALANDSTRIVLAGDHMQMSPELFSAFAKERKLHISLLERLYDHYPSNFPCKILLCENYRAHEAIIKFTSELFYEQKLIASGKQPRHDKFYPLTFFTTRGEDVQDKNSTAFYNNAEVYEIVERVSELRKKWPSSWGKMNDASIGIMTPYADQVFRIRLELRKRRMGGISVERVLNVQGKQFRAVFLSTVRTRRTCLPSNVSGVSGAGYPSPSNNANEDADYGFLSNSKLLNTAITRAQSLVAVVGDPVALCSIGRCRKVWERFIEICDENKSLFGLTLWQLRSQLDGVELKRGYVLNPLAPEFVPRSLQPEAYLRDQTAMYLALAANNHHPMGPLPGHHHGPGNMAGGPHPSLLAAGGPGQVPPHHAAQQMQNMYGPHTAAAAAYNAAAAAVMMNQGMVPGKGGGHHFHGHPNHMPMRPIGPPPSAGGPQQQSQPPPAMSGQQFNTRGPPPPAVHLGQPPAPGGANQFSQYMPWQHAQQQIRPPGSGGNFSAGVGQQLGLPTAQNPNASLWGPPPQTNPWSVLPKQSQLSQQPQTNANGTNGRQMPSQQTGQNMRGNSLPLQPPPPLANQPQQQQMRNNPNDLGFLANKALYAGKQHPGQGSAQVPPPPGHANFTNFGQGNLPPQPPPPNQMQMMNQRNMSGLPNGPISPMDPFMPRPPTAAGAPNQNAFFGQNNIPGQMKDKDFQFLNNVHVPLNIGGTMFQAQPPPPPPPNAMVGAANKQQSPTALRFPQPHEYASLLPPNVNIYEMAFEPKESQYKWYLKLLETQGQEAANKFTEVLRQVSAMMQQQQQPPPPPVNKPPQHMQQSYLNAGGNSAGGNTGQQQLMPRDAFLQPLMSYQQQQQQQQQAQQQRNINPYMGPTGTGNLLQPHLNISSVNDETPPLDINFNQQIDMVFNSIINGNEISQPILRDLFGVAGGSNNTSVMNGGDLLLNTNNTSSNSSIISGSKMFPTIGGNNGQPAGNITKIGAPPNMLGMSAPQQQPQTANPHGGGYMTNNALMNNKDYLMGTQVGGVNSSNSTSSSVPLYRRQGLAMGNGHQQQQLNSTGGNSAASTGGHSLASSTPDNLLTGNPNDIFAGLTAGSSTLIEALFQQDQQQQNNATLQKLLYNNFNAGGGVGGSVGSLKNDLDLFMSNNAFVTGLSDGINNAFHTQNFQQPTNNVQQHPANNSVVSTVDNRNTTYAAVLSQGPQQHEAAALQQQHQQQQQQQQHHKQNLNHSFQHNSMINNIGATGNGLGLGLSVGATTNNGESVEKDPFAAIRELGQGTNGFYNYFQ